MENEIQRLSEEISMNLKKIESNDQKMSPWKDKISSNNLEIQRLQRELQNIQKIIEFFNLKISLHSQESGIKGMLQSLIKADFPI